MPRNFFTAEEDAFLVANYPLWLTQYECAVALDRPRSSIQRAARRLGLVAIRDGQRSGNKRKETVSYRQQHRRVEVARGKAFGCVECGDNTPGKRYHWANLTGNYDDVSDYQPMCPSCHKIMDTTFRDAS
jgi:hypothetical protein